MPYPATLISFSAGTIIRSSDVVSNFTTLRDSLLTALLKDTVGVVTVGHTFSAAQTFTAGIVLTPTSGNGLTLTPFVGGKGIVINTAIQTTSQPVLDLAQTWNAAGVTFTGLTLTVTDTASAAASLLLNLLVGASSKFKVDKTGAGTFAAGLTIAGALTGLTTLSLAGPITLTTAASKIIPGATSLSLRNTGDSADNFIITDAGAATMREQLRINANVATGTFLGERTTDGLVFVAQRSGTVRFSVNITSAAGTTGLLIDASQVVHGRHTGWAVWTGTKSRVTKVTDTATLPEVAAALGALLDDLHATAGHGLIGT